MFSTVTAQGLESIQEIGKESSDLLWPVDNGYGYFFDGAEKNNSKK